MKIWLIMQYLNQFISMILITIELSSIEIGCFRNGDKVYMVTEPLDVKDLLIQNTHEMWTGLPLDASVGYMHLHVSNLNKSRKFYQDVCGLYHMASYSGAYFFTADQYHHHVATNTCIGANILPVFDNGMLCCITSFP